MSNHYMVGHDLKRKIPLSWSHKEIESPKFSTVNLPMSGQPWVYSAEIPAKYGIKELVGQLELRFPDGFLLRGCSSEIASYLQKRNYEIIRTGAEAIYDLDNLDNLSKSLCALVSRGEKYGLVKEISLTEDNRSRVSQFIYQTPYGSKPNLKYLFNNDFDSNTRCFIVNSLRDQWLAVVTVSVSGKLSCHTEMILRNKKAPVGVMEFLFFSILNVLKDEGYRHLSFGEVPFVTPESLQENNCGFSIKRSLQEFLLFKSGHLLKYAFNYQGLFDFKNKFDPKWKPVYICTTQKVPFISLLDLYCKTGYFNLSRSEIVASIKSHPQISTSAS